MATSFHQMEIQLNLLCIILHIFPSEIFVINENSGTSSRISNLLSCY